MASFAASVPIRVTFHVGLGEDGEPVNVAECLCRLPIAFKPDGTNAIASTELDGRLEAALAAFAAAFERG